MYLMINYCMYVYLLKSLELCTRWWVAAVVRCVIIVWCT